MTNNKINIIFPSSTRFSLPSYIIAFYTQYRNLSTEYTPIHTQILTQEPPSKPHVEKTRPHPPSFPPSIYHCTKGNDFARPYNHPLTIDEARSSVCVVEEITIRHPPTNVSLISRLSQRGWHGFIVTVGGEIKRAIFK